MNRKNRNNLVPFVIILFVIFLIIAGCTPTKKIPGQGKTAAPSVTPAPVSQAPVTTTPVIKPSVIPKPLGNFESDAEDMIDDIQKSNWKKVNERMTALQKDWDSYKPLSKEVNLSQGQIDTVNSDLAALKLNIQGKKQYEASLAANKVTLGAVTMMKSYQTKVPPAVGELDYYGRQVLLTSQHGDWARAAADTASAEQAWRSIQQQEITISKAHAKDFSDTISNMKKAVDGKNKSSAKKYSSRLLDQVDILENDFNKAK